METFSAQQIQILYEISMSIGTSLTLREMLKTSLLAFLKKLNCSVGGIYILKENDSNTESVEFEQVYTIPRNTKNIEAYQIALGQILSIPSKAQLFDFKQCWPLSGQSDVGSYFYILDLPKFGFMILVKHGDGLDPFIIRSLTPLCTKLASACRGCLTSEALIQARDQALQASRLKSQLLANVSHDLRTPLNAILGYGEMLEAGIYGSLSDGQYQTAERIVDSATYLVNLVNQLLDEAQLESGTLTLNLAQFSPAAIVDRVKAEIGPLAEKKGLALNSDIAPNVPSSLIGDPARIQQILSNLLGNAIKFTHQGKIDIHLYRPNPKQWAIKVSDTGPGIPAEAQAYIFDPFRQVDASTTREYSGSGLGLSIVKQLAELMNGDITLLSEAGQGSTFTVLLPITIT